MQVAAAAPAAADGRPVLVEGEILHLSQVSVDLYDGDTKQLRGGAAMVSTHRVMYVHAEHRLAWHLSTVEEVGFVAGGLFSHPKAKVALKGGHSIMLSFKGGGHNAFHSKLGEAHQRRSWAGDPAPKAPRHIDSGLVGIAAVKARLAADREAQSTLTRQAFDDVDTLMANVTRVAALARAVAARAARPAATGAGDGDGALAASISADLGLGLVNPVTRATAGSGYMPALAREVAAFATPHITAAGGVLALTDVFCLYNRARGTDLVSPADFAAAAELAGKLGLGLTPATFASGVRVLQLASATTAGAQARLRGMLGGEGGQDAAAVGTDAGGHRYTTALRVATTWRVPLPVAQQHLAVGEQQGVLVRDVSMDGTRVYLNAF